MAENPSSPTPNPSGDNKPAANKPADKRKRQPQKKLKPAQPENGKETPLWLRVLEGGGLIGSLVIWAEMISSHAIPQLLFYSIALLGCYVGICHLVYQFFKKNNWAAKLSVVFWIVLFAITAVFVWENSRPIQIVDPKEYELLPPDVVSNIVQMLKDPSGHVHPAAILICLANPDDSAVAFSEQLKKIFWDGGYLLVNGAPPSEIPEKPRVSCFVYGNAMSNMGIWRALTAILDATKSNSRPEAIGIYPNAFHVLWPPLSSLPPSASPAELESAMNAEMSVIGMIGAEFSPRLSSRPPPMADSTGVMRRVTEDGSSWTNSIVVIVIRSK
jgi:hypothetical protein